MLKKVLIYSVKIILFNLISFRGNKLRGIKITVYKSGNSIIGRTTNSCFVSAGSSPVSLNG